MLESVSCNQRISFYITCDTFFKKVMYLNVLYRTLHVKSKRLFANKEFLSLSLSLSLSLARCSRLSTEAEYTDDTF